MSKHHLLIPLVLAPLFFLSCTPSAQERADKAGMGQGPILIGIVDTNRDSFFVEGVRMAMEEVNEQGGVFGRKLEAVFRDDALSLRKGLRLAKELSGNPDIVAVIGHRYSEIAIPVSITYERNGILFISPGATNPDFIQYGGDLAFRNIPSDIETGKHMAELAERKGFRNMIVFYQRETGGRRLAEIFLEEAVSRGITILTTKSFFRWQDDFRVMLSKITKDHRFDAILLAGMADISARLIAQARDMGIDVPILGGYALDSPRLFTLAGQSARGVVVPTVFDPELPTRATRDFVKEFRTKYGSVPDMWSAQGYDAVWVLVHAMRETGSSVPIVVASGLRILQDWQSVTGEYSFTFDGDVTEKPIFFKEFHDGKFEFMDREYKAGEIDPFYVVEDITLRLPVEGIIPSVDPGLSEDLITAEVNEQLFLGLTDLDPQTYEPVPELAADWKVGEAGMSYTFRMREDVRWTDGRPVTAHDVVWAIRRNALPETGAPQAYMLHILENARDVNTGKNKDATEIGVRALDDFTVEFRLESPAAYFPALVGVGVFRPLPRETVEKHGEHWTDPENIVSNGSYKLAVWDKGMMMILARNPDYYDAEAVSIPEVRYYVVPESSVGLAMYENNELDIMGSSYLRLPLAELPRIKDDPLLYKEYSDALHFCTYAYGFNTKRPPVDDPLVRKAISAAIDRAAIIDLVTQGGEEAAATFVRPPIFGSVEPGSRLVGIHFNPPQARKWLGEAGYPEGRGFPRLTLRYNASETHSNIARAIRASLRHYLNIDTDLEEMTLEDFYAGYGEPDKLPHLFRIGWCFDYPDAHNGLYDLFHPFDAANLVGWSNREFASLTDMALESTDPEERRSVYRRAEQILCEEEAAIMPIYFEKAHCLVKSRVKGWYHMALGGQHIRSWSLEK